MERHLERNKIKNTLTNLQKNEKQKNISNWDVFLFYIINFSDIITY